MRPQVSHLASLNLLAQVSLVVLGVRDPGLIPVCALQVLPLGSPVPSWASGPPHIQHMQPITGEP